MLKWFRKQSGGSRNTGLEKLRVEIAWLLGIQIDYVAYIRFDGFDALVDEAGGIRTNIPAELRDPRYIDYPTYPTGAKFLADNNALLKGADAPRCYGGYPKPVTNWAPVMNCTRALVYVRSRHGTVGGKANNDYKREARQQQFIFDALKQVRRSISTTQGIRIKANLIPTNFYTTIPITSPADGVALFQLVEDATMPYAAVLQSPNYLVRVNQHMELNLSAVRALTAQWFAPVAP
jgi:anionic cell wall polymer biosynthesis LytR-Cps2A-Psr (LCP) family protein